MADSDESPVSRRQFFRGIAGDMLRAIGEVSGLDRLQEEIPPILEFGEDDVIVPPEQQAATLNQIFGFLEQHDALLAGVPEGTEPLPDADAEPATDFGVLDAATPEELQPDPVAGDTGPEAGEPRDAEPPETAKG